MGKTSSLISLVPFSGLSSFWVLKVFSKNVTRVTLREQLDGLTIPLFLDISTSRELFIVWR